MPLPGPAADLAGKIAAGPAEAFQPDRLPVDPVQPGQHLVHRIVDRGALGGLQAGQGGVVQHAAVQRLHDVEQGADHRPVVAQMLHPRHRHAAAGERLLDAELAIDRMGRGQQLARRLLAQDQIATFKAQPEGGIGLAAADRLRPPWRREGRAAAR